VLFTNSKNDSGFFEKELWKGRGNGLKLTPLLAEALAYWFFCLYAERLLGHPYIAALPPYATSGYVISY
jgi:hypothetical protein